MAKEGKSRELKLNVWMDGVLYGPAGAQPDEETAARITNHLAWGEPAPVEDDERVVPPTTDPVAPGSVEPAGDEDGGAGGEQPPVVEAPPTSGPGSGKAAWNDFAEANGVQVPEGASRDDIVEAVRAAGIAVD